MLARLALADFLKMNAGCVSRRCHCIIDWPFSFIPPSQIQYCINEWLQFCNRLPGALRFSNMPFAQLVSGPPGCGKSTYCDGMQQFMNAVDRKCSIVNLDPANDRTNYQCGLDVRDLIPLEDVMEQEELGPNGGVLYALEELEENWDWFQEGLESLGGEKEVGVFPRAALNRIQTITYSLTAQVKSSSSRTTRRSHESFTR